MPAAILTLIVMIIFGVSGQIPTDLDYSFIKILPYISVLVLALMGINVFLVLIIGTVLGGIIGLIDGSFTLIAYTQTIYEGFTSMQEIFILSLLIGGLAALISKEGGIDYLLNAISSRITSVKGAEFGIAALVSVADICTANNTVAIVITGPILRK